MIAYNLWILPMLSALALVSCATKAVIVEPIAPKAAHLKASADATTTAARRMGADVTGMTRKSDDLQVTLAQGALDAERGRKAGTVDQAFLDANAARWQEAGVKIGLLEAMTHAAVIDAKELSTAASAASTEAGDMVDTSIKLDAGVQTLKTELVAQAPDAALGSQVKSMGWMLLWLVVFAIVVYALIKLSPYIIKATL